MDQRNLFATCLLCFFLGASIVSSAAQSVSSGMRYGQKAIDEYKAKNYAAFLENAERAVREGPARHPQLLYHLARAYAVNARTAEAFDVLDSLARMGLGVDAAGNDDFKSLRASAGWGELGKKIAAAREPLVRGRAAFVIPDPELLPEGIAYDARRRTFYLGSVYKSKIISLDAAGRVRDFKTSGEDGLSSVLGMKADSERRLLWVCSNTRDGAAFVHKYDLDTGRLVKKYALDERTAAAAAAGHMFNDITLDGRGAAYVTDSLAAAVYEIRPGADELRLLVKLEENVYPNGITSSKDGRRLYVATFAGVSLIDVGAKTHSALEHADDTAIAGADGLYLYQNSLVAVQNANPAPDRVVRLFLNARGDRVERARVVESNHPLYALPTTGVVAGNVFFYVANTQIDRLAAGGKLSPAAKLTAPVLLKVNLN